MGFKQRDTYREAGKGGVIGRGDGTAFPFFLSFFPLYLTSKGGWNQIRKRIRIEQFMPKF